jgi:hypothetical protein
VYMHPFVRRRANVLESVMLIVLTGVCAFQMLYQIDATFEGSCCWGPNSNARTRCPLRLSVLTVYDGLKPTARSKFHLSSYLVLLATIGGALWFIFHVALAFKSRVRELWGLLTGTEVSRTLSGQLRSLSKWVRAPIKEAWTIRQRRLSGTSRSSLASTGSDGARSRSSAN